MANQVSAYNTCTRNYSLETRIPSAVIGGAFGTCKELGKLQYENITALDMSATYRDRSIRPDYALKTQDRCLALLNWAKR